ncbi:MAG: MMPL family transporter [Candidatus Njordarchaeia archaeon]
MSRLGMLARLLIRASKFTIILYIILGIVLMPFAMEATKRISVAQEEFLPKSAESVRAKEILREKFPSSELSGVIVVFHNSSGGNVINHYVRGLCENVSSWFISNLENVSSVSNYFSILDNLYNATLASYKVFLSAYNITDFIVWGVPWYYVLYWYQLYNSTRNITYSDLMAYVLANLTAVEKIQGIYNNFSSFLNSSFSSEVNSTTLKNITLSYLQGFSLAWFSIRNSTYNESILPPLQSGEYAVDTIVRFFLLSRVIDYIRNFSSELADLVRFVGANLGYSTWNNRTVFISKGVDFLKQYSSGLSNRVLEENFVSEIYSSLQGRNNALDDFIWYVYNGSYIPLLFPRSVYFSIRSGFVSKDNDTLILMANFPSAIKSLRYDKYRKSISKLREYLKTFNSGDLKIYLTGVIPFHIETNLGAKEDVERIDIVTFTIAFLLLLIFFRGIPISTMPLVLMGVTVVISRVLIILIAGATGLSISDITLTLSTTAIIGAGVDYTVFLLARYEEERTKGKSKEDAVVEVVKHAGKSVMLSGGTVMIAFGVLALSNFGLLRNVGLGVLTGIGVALLVSMTLTPATLAIFGDSIFWPRKIRYKRNHMNVEETHLYHIAKWTAKHGKEIIFLALILTIPIIYIYESTGTTYDFMELARKDSPSKIGFEILSDEIGSEAFSSVVIIEKFEKDIGLLIDDSVNVSALEAYVLPVLEALLNISGVKWVKSPYNPFLTYINNTFGLDRIISLQSAVKYISGDGMAVKFLVGINVDPYSTKAFRLIEEIKKKLDEVNYRDIDSSLYKFYIGGLSAEYRDVSYIVSADFRTLTILVIIGIIVLLAFALQSVLIPFRLEVTILLSIVWAVTIDMIIWVAFFNMKLAWFIPLFLFTVLNGLGMDYDVFLVTRIEEEKFERNLSDHEAIVYGVTHTGRIITIAGVIMSSAFASLLIARSPPTQQIGLALALGVFIDATLVRVVLVPAIMVIAGKWNWWPRLRGKGTGR